MTWSILRLVIKRTPAPLRGPVLKRFDCVKPKGEEKSAVCDAWRGGWKERLQRGGLGQAFPGKKKDNSHKKKGKHPVNKTWQHQTYGG